MITGKIMPRKTAEILRNIFGYDSFRPLQEEVINCLLQGKDTLAIMPTGGGKSLCYQIPALIFEGVTLVISPLISLMKDQVEQLESLGIQVGCLNSSLSKRDYQNTIENLLTQQLKIMFMAPETLLLERTRDILTKIHISCIAIDEAHCISEWGHDFRPEYRQLIEARKWFSEAVCLALTATATRHVQNDIKKSLGFHDSNTFIASFDRKNLFLQIVPKNEPYSQTVAFLEKNQETSGIIYCSSRRQVDELAEDLNMDGFKALPYHAGLEDHIRRENQDKFIKDDVHIMVATIAFGMGINKPDVRFVLHYDLPANIESYYQQIGRAGRDGLRAHCLLLYNYGDARRQQYFIDRKEEPHRRIARQHLYQLVSWAEASSCRRKLLLQYFGEIYEPSKCDMCDQCVSSVKEKTDVTVAAQKYFSCVKRVGECFGAGHIADILRGSESQKIKKFNHQHLSTYGIGREYSKKKWMTLARQFIEMGFLAKDVKYGSLKLTSKSKSVLRSDEKVEAVLEEEPIQFDRHQGMDDHYDTQLFEKLRILRKSMADESNIPPYVIFPDKTLVEMATRFPRSESDLLMIYGVGMAKIKRYGTGFLKVISRYCEEKGIETRSFNTMTTRRQTRSDHRKRFYKIGLAYSSGASISDLMQEYHVKKATILSHLTKYVHAGYVLHSNRLLAESELESKEQKRVFNTFRKEGTELLGPVFDALQGEISYDELKLLRLVFLLKDKML